MFGQGTALLTDLCGAAREHHSRDVITRWRPEALPTTSGCDSSDCAYCQALARLRRPGASPHGAAGGGGGCWLRHKRSRAQAASPALSASGSDAEDDGLAEAAPRRRPYLGGAGIPRVPSTGTLVAAAGVGAPGSSIWDHALLVEDTVEQHAWQLGTRRQPLDGGFDLGSGGQRSADGGSDGAHGAWDDGVDGDAYSHDATWGRQWQPQWQPPATLREAASFLPPALRGTPHSVGMGADIVCALEFEEHGWLLASAGVSKQVRIYSLASRMQHPDSDAYVRPIRCHRMPAKLSSLVWNPDAPGVVTVADYDGVVAQVDMESGHLIAEADEHCGRRVWSVSHSQHRSNLCASASEDGTVRLWAGPAMQMCMAALRPGGAASAACTSVHFSPYDANLLAVASADHNGYVYDMRRADQPLLRLTGHDRAVSYVRWLAPGCLTTASVDASLALWRLPGKAGAAAPAPAGSEALAAAGLVAPGAAADAAPGVLQPWKQLRGHLNSKNFCGLSVRPEEGLVACGSESPAAYTYCQLWDTPLATHHFSDAADGAGPKPSSADDAEPPSLQPRQQQPLFCSAVAWQPAAARPGCAPLLAAALSSGELRVLELQRPSPAAAHRKHSGADT